jgi:hypothetical protein
MLGVWIEPVMAQLMMTGMARLLTFCGRSILHRTALAAKRGRC